MADNGGAMTVTDNESAHRYEAEVDGAVAGFITYRTGPDGVRILLHTEVDAGFAGKGIGSRLVSAALDTERANGRRIVPTCPFVAAFLKRHPEYQDLVA